MEGWNYIMGKLSQLKESNPVEVAEYAVAMDLVEGPTFKWWVPFMLNERDLIILS